MNTRIIALTCILAAAGCAGAGNQPAQAPASSTNYTAPSDSNATVASATDPVAATPNKTFEPATTSNNAVTPANVVPSGTTSTVANNAAAADQTKNADNTKSNNRDRGDALTPMDQGNSEAETKITATIRKGIMGDKSLSFDAKNIKVITVGNKVTLRGPVKNDQERASVEAIAKRTAGVNEVNNQIELKK
jgi:osmotically-inducible protein OsmY